MMNTSREHSAPAESARPAHTADPANVLPYARRARKISWKSLLVTSVCIALFVGVGWVAYAAWERIKFLESERRIGPVDWSAVLSSGTLRSVAWRLSSDPTLFKRWNHWDPPADSPIANRIDEHMSLDLTLPIRYENGEACLDFVLTNCADHDLVLPPLHVTGTWPPPYVRSTPMISLGPWLGYGVQVMHPGQSITRTVRIVAPPEPHATMIWFSVPGGGWLIGFGPGGEGKFPKLSVAAWNDVGPDNMVIVTIEDAIKMGWRPN